MEDPKLVKLRRRQVRGIRRLRHELKNLVESLITITKPRTARPGQRGYAEMVCACFYGDGPFASVIFQQLWEQHLASSGGKEVLTRRVYAQVSQALMLRAVQWVHARVAPVWNQGTITLIERALQTLTRNERETLRTMYGLGRERLPIDAYVRVRKTSHQAVYQARRLAFVRLRRPGWGERLRALVAPVETIVSERQAHLELVTQVALTRAHPETKRPVKAERMLKLVAKAS